MTVYIEKEQCDHVRILNGTGAALSQFEFAIVGPFAGVADEGVESAAVGSFHVEGGIQVQASDLQTSEDTFATVGQSVYWNSATKKFSDTYKAGYYRVGYLLTAKDSDGVILFEKSRYATLIPSSELAGTAFRKTVTLTSAAAGTAVEILADAAVGTGRKAYIVDFLVGIDGSTAWTDSTATIVKIQDTNGTPVVGATLAKAQLTANAVLGKTSTGVTLGDAIKVGDGFTTAKGLVVIADANFAAGSDLVVTVFGFIE